MKRFLCLRVAPTSDRRPSRPKHAFDWPQLAVWCEQFSPLVGFDDEFAPQSLLLDMTGVTHALGSERALAEHIARELGTSSRVVHLAWADTLGAAWAVARYGVANSDDAKDRRAARGSHALIVAAGEAATRAALAPLPLAALRLDAEQSTWLDALGIERVEQLMALPRGALAERFGPGILRRYDQALGRIPEPLIPYRAPPERSSERVMEYPLEQLEAIVLAIGEQLAPLLQPLLAQRHGVQRMHVELQGEIEGVLGVLLRFTVGVYSATDRREHLLELIRLQLERAQLRGAVSKIRLVISAAGPLDYRQGELFLTSEDTTTNLPLVQLIDRLSNRLGWESVSRARLVRDAQPELAWQAESWLSWFSRHATLPRARRATSQPGFQLPRPLRLLERPAPLTTTRNTSGPPSSFRWEQRELHVSRHWGPERIETGWWRGRNVRRDYYLIETTMGSRAWLFQELQRERWFLHGWYD